MVRLNVWVCAALVSAASAKTAGYGDDLYGDEAAPAYEAPKPAYEPPAYHAPAPAYHAPEPYHEPPIPPADTYSAVPDYQEEPSKEYEGVPYEEEKMEYFPQAAAQKKFLEPCKVDADCGQGICDVDYRCRCMDYWWTPDPKPETAAFHGPQAAAYHEPAPQAAAYHEPAGYRRLREVDVTDRSLFEDDLELIQEKTRPCSLKRKSQAEAFLLQLFLGYFGMGCFYLGWNGLGAACFIFGMFPLVWCIVTTFCETLCTCCVKPIAKCVASVCCCFYPKTKPMDIEEDEYERQQCKACCGSLAGLTFVILWIVSLAAIANDCNTDGGIPCVPW